MSIFKLNKKKADIDQIIRFIEDHKKVLSGKCRNAYDSGDIQSGRWWDCQACAMISLINELKKEFK